MFANGLAARGHNVTILSADRDKNPPNGVHYIHIEGLYNEMYLRLVKHAFKQSQSNPIESIIEDTHRMPLKCKGAFIPTNTHSVQLNDKRTNFFLQKFWESPPSQRFHHTRTIFGSI